MQRSDGLWYPWVLLSYGQKRAKKTLSTTRNVVAVFQLSLSAWWSAEECGGFDLTDLWNLDMEIVEAMQRILFVLPNYHFYPDRTRLR